MKKAVWMAVALIAVIFVGCGGGSSTGPSASAGKFAFVGDSITHGRKTVNDAGPSEPGFRVRLLELLASSGRPMEGIESGEPGSLSRHGVERIGEVLSYDPDILNILYGTNDAFVGVPPEETISNLERMVSAGRSAGVIVVLGTLPPACGNDQQAERIRVLNPRIRDLAASLNRSRGEVYLADIANEFAMRGGCRLINPANGVHPTEEGYALIAETIFASVCNVRW